MNTTSLQWYLKISNGSVYGPIDLSTLYDWAMDERVMPDDQVSRDGIIWEPVTNIHILNIYWNNPNAGAKHPIIVSKEEFTNKISKDRGNNRCDIAREYNELKNLHKALQEEMLLKKEDINQRIEILQKENKEKTNSLEQLKINLEKEREKHTRVKKEEFTKTGKLYDRIEILKTQANNLADLFGKMKVAQVKEKEKYSFFGKLKKKKETDLSQRINLIQKELNNKTKSIDKLGRELIEEKQRYKTLESRAFDKEQNLLNSIEQNAEKHDRHIIELQNQIESSRSNLKLATEKIEEEKLNHEITKKQATEKEDQYLKRIKELEEKSRISKSAFESIKLDLNRRKNRDMLVIKEKESALANGLKRLSLQTQISLQYIGKVFKKLEEEKSSRILMQECNLHREKELTKQIENLQKQASLLHNNLEESKSELEKQRRNNKSILAHNNQKEKWLSKQISQLEANIQGMKWYLRIEEDKSVRGPVDISVLSNWVAQCRVGPGDEVSSDQKNWIPLEKIPDLGMEWMIEMPGNKMYGPLSLSAIEELLREGLIAKDAKIINQHTHKTSSVSKELESFLASLN